jgi:hypothetical protein
MHIAKCKVALAHLVAGIAALATGNWRLGAEEVLSNLTNFWPSPWVSIGDVQALKFCGPMGPYFVTGGQSGHKRTAEIRAPGGAGIQGAIPEAIGLTNAASFQLNWVTLEFTGPALQPWTDVQVALYEQVGTNSALVGQLGIPAVDPQLTEWPESVNPSFCTTYVDFLPSTEICLQPKTEYLVSVATHTPGIDFGVIFTLSSNYVSEADWRQGPTFTTHDPWAAGEFIKFALDVTGNAGPCSSQNTLSNISLSATRVGTNLLLSWPASPYGLYSSATVAPPAWAPVPDTPLRSDADLVVTLPLTNVSRCFRLQAP